VAIHNSARPETTQEDMLRRLIEERGLRDFAFFFLTGEGRMLPNGLEVTSGTVVDRTGAVHSFWTAWDKDRQVPTLSRWRKLDPNPDWLDDEEYQAALAAVGLAQ